MNKERLDAIKNRIIAALDEDSWKEDSEEGRDIRMMEEMLNYITLLNIPPEKYEKFVQYMERADAANPQVDFYEWVRIDTRRIK